LWPIEGVAGGGGPAEPWSHQATLAPTVGSRNSPRPGNRAVLRTAGPGPRTRWAHTDRERWEDREEGGAIAGRSRAPEVGGPCTPSGDRPRGSPPTVGTSGPYGGCA
jgi:hypothetical protein